MSGTRTRRGWVGAGLRLAAALALAAAVLGFGPAAGVGAAASSTGATLCAPSGEGGTTCTGTFGGDTAWDNYLGAGVNGGTDGLTPGGAMISAQPQVTVDQTVNLTNQIVHVTWSNFTPSGYSGDSAGCDLTPNLQLCNGFKKGFEFYPVYVIECKGSNPADWSACNTLFVGTPTSGAAGNAVESYTQGGKTTQATDCSDVPTDNVCGTGYTDIQIQTSVQNQTLGCSSTTACSLVVVPQWGGVSDGVPADCENHLQDLWFGSSSASDEGQTFTTCAWNDRVVVPLSFAPTPQQYCGSNDYAFSAQGSPMLERVMAQWQPSWCTSSSGKVNFNYDSAVNEYEARAGFLGNGSSGVSSATDVALVTDPPPSTESSGSSRQFTYAPITTTAITIAYYVDNQTTQEPVTDLKLDARLVAKLLTESYSLDFSQCQSGQTQQSDTCDPKVAGNPVSIFADPEFYKLNPQYTEADFVTETNGLDNSGDFLPIVLAGNSDMTYELTRWVESDPEARAFLAGQPDPWGMHVNLYYEQGQSQSYPLTQYQVLDPGFHATVAEIGSGSYPYLSTMQVAWNPVTGLDNVASALAGWTPTGDQFAGSCTNPSTPLGQCQNAQGNLINAKDAADPFPQRALFAILDAGTAAAYRFPTAQLVNPAGNAEPPNTDTMTAAVDSMKTNPDGITQYDDYQSEAANAYPLTEVQYAMVPTCGLASTKAGAISTLLQDVSNSQTYGVGLGQIPPFGGYLALDDAQKQQDLTAAQAVGQQTCKGTKPDTTVSGQTPPASNNSGSGNPNNTGNGNPTTPGTTPTSGASGHATAGASPKVSATPIGLGDKAADTSGDVKYILPAALAAGALLAIGGPLAYGYGTTGGFRLPRPRRRGTPGAPAPDAPDTPDSGGDLDG
jgi:hypothetical protein